MSDQISEKMARKVYEIFCVPKNQYSGGADGFVARLRSADLIKPSKLDEVREWVRENEYARGSEETHRSYATGVRACASHFEDAITEILEERK